MPIEFLKGNLFGAHELDALAHGCNCAGAMGKGIAVEFRRRFPEMYEEYRSLCHARRFNLGDVFTWSSEDLVVFNLATQKTWRTGASLDAVRRSLEAMARIAEERGLRRVGLPRIAAGLGGLDWSEVRAELIAVAAGTPVMLVVFEEYLP